MIVARMRQSEQLRSHRLAAVHQTGHHHRKANLIDCKPIYRLLSSLDLSAEQLIRTDKYYHAFLKLANDNMYLETIHQIEDFRT